MQATRNHPLCPFLLLQVLLKAKTHAKVKHVCASMSIYGVRKWGTAAAGAGSTFADSFVVMDAADGNITSRWAAAVSLPPVPLSFCSLATTPSAAPKLSLLGSGRMLPRRHTASTCSSAQCSSAQRTLTELLPSRPRALSPRLAYWPCTLQPFAPPCLQGHELWGSCRVHRSPHPARQALCNHL